MSNRLAGASIAFAIAFGVIPRAVAPDAISQSGELVQRHHYAINARVRPLLLFWIGRSGVGDAVVTRRQGPNGAGYSLLIGSDPDRAPRRINRWGYIDEDVRGSRATLIGLMTDSDEDSIEQAEANIRKEVGDRTFRIIRATIEGDQARSVVTSVATPANYSFRQLGAVLDLAHQSSDGRTRVVRLPSGTRPGFLVAVAELVHAHVDQWRATGRVQPGPPIAYVYHGRIYQLTVTHAQPLATVRVGGATYTHAITSQVEVMSTYDGELTQFSMTYGAEGRFAETLLAASYQPRWWLEIDLALDDSTPGPAVAGGFTP